jgi:biopolymer transport protein ExbD
MSVHVPGPRLGNSIPFKHLGIKGGKGAKNLNASLNLTPFVDMMTILVTFLLMTFSATGDILMSQRGLELPEAVQQKELERAPIITVTMDSITFNGEPMGDPRAIMADQSLEWKLLELYERLKIEHQQFELQPMSESEREKMRGLLILQADKHVDAKVLNRVLMTAYASEYHNIMFAVNQRSAR